MKASENERDVGRRNESDEVEVEDMGRQGSLTELYWFSNWLQ